MGEALAGETPLPCGAGLHRARQPCRFPLEYTNTLNDGARSTTPLLVKISPTTSFFYHVFLDEVSCTQTRFTRAYQ